MIKAYAANEAKGEFKPFEYEPGELRPEQVEIKVHSCGLCHSDISIADNEWGFSQYPVVPGHEVIGEVIARGDHVKHLDIGAIVGLGWFSGSCMHCLQCMSGNHNLCPSAESTILGRHGGFADRVRCNAEWAIELPTDLDAAKAGPLFCGGITVFNPIVEFDVKPTDRVAVLGVGGLGHLALQFLNKWGCEVTAFSSNPAKEAEALSMGAHHVINSKDSSALEKAAGSFDFILSTVNVELDWPSYLGTLAPKGRFHTVGAIPTPMSIPAFSLIGAQRSVSGSPLGAPATTTRMLEFCARHGIAAVTEHFPMAKINDAFEHLRAGKARYRIVLDA
ncbi:MAG: NAD(P)-dependent alcohol dehydrogenase [Myxococcales bacterium]|nr:MAG: NAD(P)-dependent alcohol dehydrogenase [Myxococcales bacterium]